MNFVETALIFAGIPAAIIAVLGVGSFGTSLLHHGARYRPGRPWTYAPVWYVPHPQALTQHRPALPAGETSAVGGASGEW